MQQNQHFDLRSGGGNYTRNNNKRGFRYEQSQEIFTAVKTRLKTVGRDCHADKIKADSSQLRELFNLTIFSQAIIRQSVACK